MWVALSSISRKRGERGRGKRKIKKSENGEEDGEGETGREGEMGEGEIDSPEQKPERTRFSHLPQQHHQLLKYVSL